MEWNRGDGQTQPANQPVAHTGGHRSRKGILNNFRLFNVILLFAVAILLVALVSSIAFGDNASQSKYVNDKEMQAVFLNGGQVYFGHIKNLNDKFMRVADIYYLRVNQTVQPNGNTSTDQNISLVKLGCELHGPEDAMVINQDQVIFWENLKADGQVAKAVAQFVQQNPKGQNCNSTNNSSSTNSTSNSNTGNSSANNSTTNNSATNNTTNSSTNSTTKKQ